MATAEARDLVARIEALGLPYSDPKALSSDDPLFLAMIGLIFSDEAKTAAIKATGEGQPALLYIDPMLVAKFGNDYNADNMATNSAGRILAELMRTLGYRTTGRSGKLPSTCVAKTAEIYEPAR